jgi:hypothetical protein
MNQATGNDRDEENDSLNDVAGWALLESFFTASTELERIGVSRDRLHRN